MRFRINRLRLKCAILIAAFCIPSAQVDAALDSIAFSGNPGIFTFTTLPSTLTNTSTTYSVSTISLTAKRITGQLNTNLPTGMTLVMNLQAPLIGTSAGDVTLSTTPQTLVSGIVALALQSGLQVTYKLTATLQTSPVVSGSTTLTFTLL